MSEGIARLNDLTTGICLIHGPQRGKIITASGTVSANNKLIARLGDTVEADCGDIGVIDSASGTVSSDQGVARLGDSFSGIYTGTIDGSGDNPPDPPTVKVGG
jgi:uncharacterized Zn-binding protein involved in type VI secretion